jgi:hypothetical protein
VLQLCVVVAPTTDLAFLLSIAWLGINMLLSNTATRCDSRRRDGRPLIAA